MWIQSLTRAVSIVAVPNPSTPLEAIQIRGRLRSDVEGLVRGVRIIHTPTADYHYRILVSTSELQRVLINLALEVTYPNFKSAVMRRGTMKRYHVYADIHHLIEKELSESRPNDSKLLATAKTGAKELRETQPRRRKPRSRK